MRRLCVVLMFLFFFSPMMFCQNAEDESVKTETPAQTEIAGEPQASESAEATEEPQEKSHGFFASVKEQFTDNSQNEVVITHLLSFDFMLLAMQLSNLGIGFGIQYERQIVPHFAAKGYFGHAVIDTHYRDAYCLTVTFALFAEWYPLSRQMRKLYVGMGGYFDYLGYQGDDIPAYADGVMLSIFPQIGYKFSLPWHFLLDVNCGYKYSYSMEGEAYGDAANYLKKGFQYGLSLKRVIRQ